jgi:hypothetical protein
MVERMARGIERLVGGTSVHGHDRIVVSERDARASQLFRGVGDRFGKCDSAQTVQFTCFADAPILTKQASEITSCGSERKNL